MNSEEPAQKRVKTDNSNTSTSENEEVMKEIEGVVEALREHLESHDKSRKKVQEKLHRTCEKQRKDVDEKEKKAICEIEERHEKKSNKLQKALCETTNNKNNSNNSNEVIKKLEECEEERRVEQEEVCEAHEVMRKMIDENEKEVNKSLEEHFTNEDSCIQAALCELMKATSTTITSKEGKNKKKGKAKREVSEALQKAKAELVVVQKHSLNEVCDSYHNGTGLPKTLKLETKKEIDPEWLDISKPSNLKAIKVNNTGKVFIHFTRNDEQERVFSVNGFGDVSAYKALLQKKGEECGKEHSLRREEKGEKDSFSFVPDFLESEVIYTVKVKAVVQGKEGEWSEEVEFTPEFAEGCVWKECPDYVVEERKYSVNKKNPRVATKTVRSIYGCNILGSTSLPPNKVTSWSIKILKSEHSGDDIFVGVTLFDMNQNGRDCGWYFDCGDSGLFSVFPYKYSGKEYGPRKGRRQYVHTGDSVGVVMDTTKGELSFIVNGVNLGVAFDGIPLDKPLVPCVILCYEGDSIELDTSEVEETKVNSSIPVP